VADDGWDLLAQPWLGDVCGAAALILGFFQLPTSTLVQFSLHAERKKYNGLSKSCAALLVRAGSILDILKDLGSSVFYCHPWLPASSSSWVRLIGRQCP
jgi:hypothetical protein